MARALWKGAISFGLVNIPVELHSAEDRKSFKFSMLDKRDLAPVGYKRYNKTSGKEVPWENIVKGYEYEKDRYVVLSDEDFRRANVKATQTIDIRAFVPLGEIPLAYYETPYYLAPAPRGEKVYALLRETLKATGRVAVAEVVMRTTPHLAVVVPSGNALMLDTLRFEDELRDAKGLDLPADGLKSAGITSKEVELAKRLVEDMAGHFDPAQYRNTYHDDLMARIDEKIKAGQTEEITEPGKDDAPTQGAKVIDLAELLKQSLARGSSARRQSAAKGNGATSKAPGERATVHPVGKAAARTSGKRAAKTATKRTATTAHRKRA